MIEPPQFDESAIVRGLVDRYGLTDADITFLPIGYDQFAWVYRVRAGGQTYFAKLRLGKIKPASLAIPAALHAAGITHVPAPIPSRYGQPFVTLADDYRLILYPFIEGKNGGRDGMTPDDWEGLGRLVGRIHRLTPPASLLKVMSKEKFVSVKEGMFQRVRKTIQAGGLTDPYAVKLAALWERKRHTIDSFYWRMNALGKRLRADPPPFVVCHADSHPYNVMVEPDGAVWLVDWDEAIYAPKERDLMFVGRSAAMGGERTPSVERYYDGYGDRTLDPVALAYYRYEWAVQEFAEYAHAVLFRPDFGDETKKSSLDGFAGLFADDGVVTQAMLDDVKPARDSGDTITVFDLSRKTRQQLNDLGITTYTALFAHIDDPNTPNELRRDLLWMLTHLSNQVDRRRAVQVVLRALRSPDDDIRSSALWAAEILHLKRTIPLVMSLARDKAESSDIRNGAVRALGGLCYPGGSHTELIEQTACEIIFDETDAVVVRAEALELFSPAVVKRYGLDALTGLLSHPSADLRFWAAFGFPSIGGCDDDGCRLDITAAIPVLDHLVAFDHTVPEYWGWHVGREALEALENFYAHQYGLSRAGVWLISPAKEYMTFSSEMRTFVQWGKPFEMKDGYDARPALNVDPAWLADQLRATYPSVNFEARPGSKAYLLSGLVETEGEIVLGGLHRDGYALVLTGAYAAILRVARWYRGIISSETPLYLYEWAGPAELLEGL